jgi:hypothetical protein
VHVTGGRKTTGHLVRTTTAIAVLEIASKPGSASDRETANAVALYAPRKGALRQLEPGGIEAVTIVTFS